MAKFDIGSFAASLNETVSKLDTSEEPQLRYVDIDLLDANEANFYAVDVSKLDTLADSIAMDGLQQPLVVTAGQDGRYTVISGHRRRAAIRKLVEEDSREDLRRVPCLVRVYQSQALAELQLIMANSTARVLTSAEVMHQAQRMEELLYQLKEEGYSFPGRMRDQVAEACQVSATKLARLKVINARLCSEYMELFNQNKVSEQVAYALAKLPQDFQRRIFRVNKAPPVARVVEALTEEYKKGARWEPCLTCPDGKACARGDAFLRHDCENEYNMCKGEKCCLECSGAKTDCYPCGRMCSKAQAVRKEKRDDAKAKELSWEEKVQAKRREEIKAIASRLVKAADLADLSDTNKISMGRYTGSWSIRELREFAAGDFGSRKFAGWEFGQDDMERFIGVSQKLQCSVDYIMGLTDEIRSKTETAPAPEWLPLKWVPGTERPPRVLDAACVLGLSEKTAIKDVATWDGEKWIDGMGEPWDLPCLRWFPIPEDDDEEQEEV